jgi:hypothetical protein
MGRHANRFDCGSTAVCAGSSPMQRGGSATGRLVGWAGPATHVPEAPPDQPPHGERDRGCIRPWAVLPVRWHAPSGVRAVIETETVADVFVGSDSGGVRDEHA